MDMKKIALIAFTGLAVSLGLVGCNSSPTEPGQVVGMRRLTEAQYRNTIADIFGPDITVAGRFEPIIRPTHSLISAGASAASISPAGLEQFDSIARTIASQVFDEAHRAVFVKCTPQDPKQPDDKCAESVLLPLGRYAFRRPLFADEQKLYLQIAHEAAVKTGSFYDGLGLSLSSMLVSPNFLYVVETAKPDPSKAGALQLDDYSRAARLSYFLWDTTPNDTLLSAAEKGELSDQGKLEAIAAKMTASPRLEDGVRAFFSDMLVYEKFDDLTKDPIIFPRYNSVVAKALPEQMLRTIVGYLVDENGDYPGLFTTRHTTITRVLGPIYGVPVHASTGWEPLELSPDSGRAGLIGQAGFLALYSQVGRSSPTLRGRAIRDLLVCEPVPDPPANVNFSVVQDTHNPNLRTARNRLTQHVTDPVCAACHKIIDPIGLTLENFDGIGAFRTEENGAPIDAKGTWDDGKNFAGVVGIGERIAADPAATECVKSRAVEYATGGWAEPAGVMEQLQKNFAAGGYKIRTLFRDIAVAPSLYQIPQANLAKSQQASLSPADLNH
jgi:Protein of unknown function (DUF1588)/Protein of unknown function (DUF1592)/Protein of unknown function (DUF1595)/Protein of unknown function (DUF1587)